jgi:hypothetical protein
MRQWVVPGHAAFLQNASVACLPYPGLHPGLVCRAPLGHFEPPLKTSKSLSPSSIQCPIEPVPISSTEPVPISPTRYLAQWLTVSRPVSHGACPYLAQWLTEPVPGPMPQRPNRACPHVRHRPNGAAHTSPGCNPGIGSLMNRMRSEGTPHHGRANGWSRVMRRSFRTRRSLVCHTRGCTPGWYAVPRWGTSNRLSKRLRACPHLQFNVP